MNDYTATGNYYTISHVVQFTGLSERTIRSYISSGLLVGEKINGLWHFTSEQVDAFMRNPNVRPSILAKKNSIVYDFMLDNKKNTQQICIIADLPGDDPDAISQFFCSRISNGNYHDLCFSSDHLSGAPRVILRGHPAESLELISAYYR